MPPFGDILSRDEIDAVAEQVLALSGRSGNSDLAAHGAAIFADQCAVCHGDAGEGLPELGGPRLNDQIWLYGGDSADIVAQIARPKHGVMPAWSGRLDPETMKILAVYVHSLGGGQ